MTTKKNILFPLKTRFIGLLFILSNYAFAVTYYVDSKQGDDSNNGLTEATAWKTIGKVSTSQNMLQPGDVISFKKDQTFYGRVYFDGLNGTDNNPITFTSYGEGPKSILTGISFLYNPTWSYEGGNMWSTPMSIKTERLWHNNVEQKRVIPPRGQSWDGQMDGQNKEVWVYNNNKLYYYSEARPTGIFSYNGTAYAMRFDNSSYINIENLDLQGGVSAALQVLYSNHINVKNNIIGKKAGYGFTTKNSSNMLIEQNIFDADFTIDVTGSAGSYAGVSDGLTLAGGSTNNEVRNNNFINWGHQALTMESTGTEISNNKIHHNFFTAPDIVYGGAITYSGNAHHNEIYNNYIYDMPKDSQLGGNYNHFHHNIIDKIRDTPVKSGNQGDAITLEDYSLDTYNNTIEYNTITNTEGAAIHIIASGNKNDNISKNTFRKNLIKNCGQETGKSRSLFIEHYVDIREQYFYDNAIVWDKTNTHNKIYYRQEYLTVDEFNAKNLNNIKNDKMIGNIDTDLANHSVGAGLIDLSNIGVTGETIESNQQQSGAFIMKKGMLQ